MRWGELYNRPITRALVSLWLEHFGGEDPTRLAPALRDVEKQSEFFPSPATVRRLINEKGEAQDQLAASRAFEELVRYVRCWGSDRLPNYTGSQNRGGKPLYAPELPAPTLRVLLEMGGYEEVALALENGNQEQVHWLRKEFVRLYEYREETANYLAPTREEARELMEKVRQFEKALPEPAGVGKKESG